MSVLKIFADESGTMPIKNDDEIFVVASIATTTKMSNFSNKIIGERDWLAQELKSKKVYPSVVYVSPHLGFQKKLENKINKMKLMARTTKLMTGANAKYISNRNVFNDRNYIWTACMSMSISEVVMPFLSQTIDKIKVIIDQMSLAKETENLLNYMILVRLEQEIKKIISKYPQLYKGGFNFSPNFISLYWRDNPSCPPNSDKALKFADRLAHFFQEDLMNSKNDMERFLLKMVFDIF